MKVGKPKSKRVPVRLRNKIQKKSAAKQRKDRKDAKKNPEWRSRLKKDPGIPNLFPYKDKLLHQAEEAKRRKIEEQEARKQAHKARNAPDDDDEQMDDNDVEEDELIDWVGDSDEEGDTKMEGGDDSNPMAALLASARARAQDFDNEGEVDDEDDEEDEGFEAVPSKASQASRRDTSRHAYDKAFKEVVAASDIVLYVLDARDPLGTRSRPTEQEILNSPDRRLILVLNKIDLVPPPVLQAWLKYLRRSFPTVPIRAASSAASNAKTFDHKQLTAANTANSLVKALKNWAGSRDLKRAINVGVIGYPNVGKSSVINALMARLGGARGGKVTACPVGAEAGVTTAMREVTLDGKIKLLDSPGIVFPASATESEAPSTGHSGKATGSKSKSSEQARLVLLNAIPPKEIIDPKPAVTLLLERLSSTPDLLQKMLETYNIPTLVVETSRDFTNDFLIHVARQRGRLGKGGVPNLHAAAQTVLGDWREGRIQGWVEPPKQDAPVVTGQANGDERKIVTQWAEEFKIEGLWGDDSSSVAEADKMAT